LLLLTTTGVSLDHRLLSTWPLGLVPVDFCPFTPIHSLSRPFHRSPLRGPDLVIRTRRRAPIMSDPLTDPAMEPRRDPPNDRCCAGTAPEHVLRITVWRRRRDGRFSGPFAEKAGRRVVGAEWGRPTTEEWRVATDYWTQLV
jgi:hypothetical protein